VEYPVDRSTAILTAMKTAVDGNGRKSCGVSPNLRPFVRRLPDRAVGLAEVDAFAVCPHLRLVRVHSRSFSARPQQNEQNPDSSP
jgi:hypothetical protein